MAKYIVCTDEVKRTQHQYEEWLTNLQDLAEQEPDDLTDEEYQALELEGLIY